MNILLAVFILTFSYLEGVYVARYPKEAAIVGPVAANSIAKRAGLQTGDQIVCVHGNQIKTWEDLEVALGTAPRDALNIEVLRNNQNLQLHFDAPASKDQIDPALLGFRYSLPKAIVYAVDEGSPAQKAGLKAGDEILSVTGKHGTATGYNEILNIISESKGIPLNFRVRRPNTEPPKDRIWESSDRQRQQYSASQYHADRREGACHYRICSRLSVGSAEVRYHRRHCAVYSAKLRAVFFDVQNNRQNHQGIRIRADTIRPDRNRPDFRERCPYGQRSDFLWISGIGKPSARCIQPASNPDSGWRSDSASPDRRTDSARSQP